MDRRALVAGVRTVLSDNDIDIFEMEESFGSAAAVAESLPIPVCVRLHGPWFLNGAANGAPKDNEFRMRVAAEGAAIARAAAVTAPSFDVLQRTRQAYGIDLARAEVIPHPVFRPPTDGHWNPLDCEPLRLLFIGRFDRHKGGDLVIEAFARVLDEIPQARLTFVGPDRGFVAEDGRTWHLPAFVDQHIPGALQSGRVQWLGQLPFDALASLRLRAAVTLVASRYETFCYTATEAMAVGSPIVATRAGAIPELITNGKSGLLCDREDPEDMARAIIRLLSDRGLAAALGRQASEDCERLFHPEVIASRMVAFYRRVISNQAKPGWQA